MFLSNVLIVQEMIKILQNGSCPTNISRSNVDHTAQKIGFSYQSGIAKKSNPLFSLLQIGRQTDKLACLLNQCGWNKYRLITRRIFKYLELWCAYARGYVCVCVISNFEKKNGTKIKNKNEVRVWVCGCLYLGS